MQFSSLRLWYVCAVFDRGSGSTMMQIPPSVTTQWRMASFSPNVRHIWRWSRKKVLPGCQQRDLQIRLGISAQALMVEAHSCSTNKNYEILMSSKSRPAPPKRIQQTSEPLDLRETSQETQSRESAGQPIFSSFTSFPWFQWSNLRKNSPQSNTRKLVGTSSLDDSPESSNPLFQNMIGRAVKA